MSYGRVYELHTELVGRLLTFMSWIRGEFSNNIARPANNWFGWIQRLACTMKTATLANSVFRQDKINYCLNGRMVSYSFCNILDKNYQVSLIIMRRSVHELDLTEAENSSRTSTRNNNNNKVSPNGT